VGGVGCFPSPAEPRVIWAGLTAGQSDVTALFRAVEGTCAKLGFPRERKPFSAHITLGRQRSSHRAAVLADALAGAMDSEYGGFTVSAFTLFRSDLRPTGPVYTAAGTFPFGA
jgi:2'-5' RNA ligase